MNVASRPVATGKTRICPHCKATILESLSICPGCMHHLRFDQEAAKRQVAATSALRVEGVIQPPASRGPVGVLRGDRRAQRPRRGSDAPGGERRGAAERREAHLHAVGRSAAAAGTGGERWLEDRRARHAEARRGRTGPTHCPRRAASQTHCRRAAQTRSWRNAECRHCAAARRRTEALEGLLRLHDELHLGDSRGGVEWEGEVDVDDVAEPRARVAKAQAEARVLQ